MLSKALSKAPTLSLASAAPAAATWASVRLAGALGTRSYATGKAVSDAEAQRRLLPAAASAVAPPPAARASSRPQELYSATRLRRLDVRTPMTK